MDDYTYWQIYPELGEPLEEWQWHRCWMHFLADLRSECLKERPRLGSILSWEGTEVIYRLPKMIGSVHYESWREKGELPRIPDDGF